jgi:ribosomal protein L22
MAGTNTEKPTGKNEIKKQVPAKVPEKKKIENMPVKKPGEKEEKKDTQQKKEKKKIEVKKVKKTKVFVNAKNLPISPKVASAICKFIKKKSIEQAIKDLEEVSNLKKPIPMKGEIPHRKGKIMSGRFPTKAAKEFITLLKSLKGNAMQHEVENPMISEAISNKGASIYGGMGRKKKRANIKIVSTQKKLNSGVKNNGRKKYS